MRANIRPFDPQAFLAKVGKGRTLTDYKKNQGFSRKAILPTPSSTFRQASSSSRLSPNKARKRSSPFWRPVTSLAKVAWQANRWCTSSAAMSECSIMRLEKGGVTRVLHSEPAFSELFLRYLLSRNIRIEEDLVDQLFNSSEKRLARVLLMMANFGKDGKAEPIIPKISQETLAEIVGTTRSRVSFFMNRFRKLGFIEYNGRLEVHSSLLNVVLHD